jgi:hypothetical protein
MYGAEETERSLYSRRVNGLREAPCLRRAICLGETEVMDAKSLPEVKMPNRDNFFPNSRS